MASFQHSYRFTDRLSIPHPEFRIPRPQFHLRPAFLARVGLRMESAVPGVPVFPLAGRAHRKRRHGGVRAIIGHRAGDGKTRTAIRAIDERVEVPAIGRVEHFLSTIIADGDVGRDQREWDAAGSVKARPDGEIGVPLDRQARQGDVRDLRKQRGFLPQTLEEHRDIMTFHVDENASARVDHVSVQVHRSGQVKYERPEPDALNDAFDYDLSALSH
jgi:hypothetical protein